MDVALAGLTEDEKLKALAGNAAKLYKIAI
jgi:hypothetical protein